MPDRRKADASRFAMVARPDVPRSAFDRYHTHKTTMGGGALVPIYVDEVLPGDSVSLSATVFARLATPLVPVMDNLYFETFFFFVPNRLVWDKWERFMGEQLDPADSTSFLIPQVTVLENDAEVSTLANYFGLPKANAAQNYSANALPFRAYNLIWNEWFRDQDLQDPLPVPVDDGPDTISTNYTLAPRGKRHDYFTTARPWPQKPLATNATSGGLAAGGLGNFIPGGDMTFGQWGGAGAPVTGLGFQPGVANAASGIASRMTGGRTVTPTAHVFGSAANAVMVAATETGSGSGMFPDVRVLVNDIRTAMQVQRLLERNARGGTRYAEIVRSHFGVISPDARLQRPEYLGGGRTMVNVSPIAQTGAQSAGDPEARVLGELAGMATVTGRNHGFRQSFTEHGWILGLANIRADLSYQRGLNRMWSRRTVFDHYFPSLAHLGEQAIMSREIWADGTAGDDAVFGYAERWSEYKYKPNMITGRFQSQASSTLDYWHLAQAFASRPSLNEAFILDLPPLSRVMQVTTVNGETVLLDAAFHGRWVRCMPMYSIPGVGARL